MSQVGHHGSAERSSGFALQLRGAASACDQSHASVAKLRQGQATRSSRCRADQPAQLLASGVCDTRTEEPAMNLVLLLDHSARAATQWRGWHRRDHSRGAGAHEDIYCVQASPLSRSLTKRGRRDLSRLRPVKSPIKPCRTRPRLRVRRAVRYAGHRPRSSRYRPPPACAAAADREPRWGTPCGPVQTGG